MYNGMLMYALVCERVCETGSIPHDAGWVNSHTIAFLPFLAAVHLVTWLHRRAHSGVGRYDLGRGAIYH